MRKLIVHLMTGYCGEDAHEALEIGDDYTTQEIDDICWNLAIQNAESYGHGDDGDDEFSERIEYIWEDYDPEKHDMLRSGGGSFEEDF